MTPKHCSLSSLLRLQLSILTCLSPLSIQCSNTLSTEYLSSNILSLASLACKNMKTHRLKHLHRKGTIRST
jgi:hypothetical protein